MMAGAALLGQVARGGFRKKLPQPSLPPADNLSYVWDEVQRTDRELHEAMQAFEQSLTPDQARAFLSLKVKAQNAMLAHQRWEARTATGDLLGVATNHQ